jgi:hypothetical protein
LNAIAAFPMRRILSVFAGMNQQTGHESKTLENTNNFFNNGCSKTKCPPIFTKPPDILSKSISEIYFPRMHNIPVIQYIPVPIINGTFIDDLSIQKHTKLPLIPKIDKKDVITPLFNITEFNSLSKDNKPPYIPKYRYRSRGAIRFL